MSDAVHLYFEKINKDFTILVQVNPKTFSGREIIIFPDGKTTTKKIHFDTEIFDDLKEDEFKESSALKFQLYLNKLV
ncbi:MAG: hypothetical protein OEY34_00335 [Cyclobacteriaceae bacterium]|nr:hypothetical protein [Cyclobacteriaceae bacterium]